MEFFGKIILFSTIIYGILFKVPLNVADSRFNLLGSRQSPYFEETNYYASAFAGIWSTAIQDCISTFGPNGHLVSIEDKEESDSLKEWLEDRGSGGSTFWTSGQYTVSTGEWFWAGGREPDLIIQKFTDWNKGHPLPTPNGQHRIGLKHLNQFSAGWISIVDSETRRYICEVNTGNPDPIVTMTTMQTTDVRSTEQMETTTNC